MINFSKLKDEIYNEIKEIKKQKTEELLKKDGEEINSRDLENMDDINNESSSSSSNPPFNVVENFKLPIFYLQEKYQLSDSIKNDLEITDNIYKIFIRNSNQLSCQTMPLFYNYYTTNTTFLKESQKLIKTLPLDKYKATCNLSLINDTYDSWEYIKTLQNFNERYDYLDYERLEKFNHYETFLQVMSIYMIASPVFSLLTPFLLLLVPFFLLKLRGNSISVANYTASLRKIIVNIPIGKLLNFSKMSNGDKAYAVVSASFYIYQIYQNCVYCKRFFKNINYMYESIYTLRDFCQKTRETMLNFLEKTSKFRTYAGFNMELQKRASDLLHMETELRTIHKTKFSKERLYQTGRVMKEFYKIRNDPFFEETIHYALSFLGYIDNLIEIRNSVDEKLVNFCGYTQDQKKTKIKNSYYLMLPENEAVKNDVSMAKNMIISGPNATGKTTYVKSTILNMILSQQFGFGFYEKAKICPYEHFHCYLNIPDTSGRDSLFQAEVRRCKEILDAIETSSSTGEKHMCIFDELFSGTNPYEATSVGLAYIEYINENPAVSFMLTTHYLDLCKHAEAIKSDATPIVNLNTETKYNINSGICKKKGGIKVLEDFVYPEKIVAKAKEIISLD
jgi:hypothetical protein